MVSVNKEEKIQITMWSDEKIKAFRKAILEWYDENRRDLPWRQNTEAYDVWVSEIMLQQTRVDTVIPYFQRFMDAFPTIKDLATADTEYLLKMWEGLGYYSRARNMQVAAQQIMEEYKGEFPSNIQSILTLKGIGPYTGGAIASIAFGLPEPAIDGNLMRVTSRLFEIDADIAKASNRKIFDAILRELIDPERPGDFNQALMDIGATLSMPTQYIEEGNPLVPFDQSYQKGTWMNYPVKTKKKKAKPVNYDAIAIRNKKGEWLVEQRPAKGLLAGMWHFPLFEREAMSKKDWKEFEEGKELYLIEQAKEKYGLNRSDSLEKVAEVKHVFTHLIWTIQLYVVEAHDIDPPENCLWVSDQETSDLVFPVPQQKMWDAIPSKMLNKINNELD